MNCSKELKLVGNTEDVGLLEQIAQVVGEDQEYDVEVVPLEEVNGLSTCDILVVYGVDRDYGFEHIETGRKVLLVPGELGDVGLESWTQGWDAYGFTNKQAWVEFSARCKGACAFIISTPIGVHSFLDSEPPQWNRTLHLVSVLGSYIDGLEEYIDAVREVHPSCGFSFIVPDGPMPSGDRISSYRPDEISLMDLFRRGNCYWSLVAEPLSDRCLSTFVKAIAFGLPVVAGAPTIGQFNIDDIGWICDGAHACKDVFSRVNGRALIDKGTAAKYQALIHLGSDVWCKDLLGRRQQSRQEANSIKPARGGLVSLYDARALYQTADEIGARRILEIGSCNGGSTVYLGAVAKKHGGRLYCIDPIVRDILRENIKLAELDDYVTIIQGASPWVDPEKVAVPLDYLFIDGEHFTRWVVADYHYWVPFVRVGGRIAFHDWGASDRAGEMVREAVRLILQTDFGSLKKVDETQPNKWGVVVFEKVREQRLNANLIELRCLPS